MGKSTSFENGQYSTTLQRKPRVNTLKVPGGLESPEMWQALSWVKGMKPNYPFREQERANYTN
jgi:hypothetical protein